MTKLLIIRHTAVKSIYDMIAFLTNGFSYHYHLGTSGVILDFYFIIR